MRQHQALLRIETTGQGLLDITSNIDAVVAEAYMQRGLCTLLVQHTSASLVIQENADPTARRDLELFLNRLVPEGYPAFTHTAEGPDDMPSHIKAALTATTLSIPLLQGRLGLGTWQGVYLWEHRRAPHTRKVLVHVLGE